MYSFEKSRFFIEPAFLLSALQIPQILLIARIIYFAVSNIHSQKINTRTIPETCRQFMGIVGKRRRGCVHTIISI